MYKISWLLFALFFLECNCHGQFVPRRLFPRMEAHWVAVIKRFAQSRSAVGSFCKKSCVDQAIEEHNCFESSRHIASSLEQEFKASKLFGAGCETNRFYTTIQSSRR